MTSDQFPDLSSAIASVHLICVDSRSNHNKFWQGYVLLDGTVFAKYGRVNYKGQTHSYVCGNIVEAQTKLQQIVRDKKAKGYMEAEVDRTPNQSINFEVLGKRAKSLKAQIHHLAIDAAIIHEQTSIRFNPEKGQYQTGLGAVTHQTVAHAQTALDRVLYAQESRNRQDLAQAVEAYLRLIPLPVGMSLNPTALIGNINQVETQRHVLETLKTGLDRIAEIRRQIQVELAAQVVEQTERSFWMNWGETEVAGIEIEFSDTRSDCVLWD
ncbi:hypothetical protein NIES2135_66680 (plasmid) [Leptolyngbya boryana NIES-2135]|jgi:predicted DNA-binding WGR domain protein|uniref:WGR domain-containing protein n=1 Tax=Leptolyngbya boryana NIES-2135 TaxID=1973484 RepID=A0A1Z4JSP1_LEPBY|nr:MULTISPECIES: WGR domain-containing protein [Leptolyngbya]BAY59791.1 hypothetical protein NIES2135_66680 [Leptolyngbya boryana NIES-2135]MBD2369655.1 WGR domain-containing protein [Leptolyngbya sp. FACHB-161]MBD2375900.1 WGR domain-containing protein [Leptolyngbya sp. FACHB-238]MBD2400176.1 WGR domain-containing protein [Leptolyngbya sp. FACHB-239]MBD2406717.1 WGR domain-containing protein [Leptolyngbya sp. FACHB-402]